MEMAFDATGAQRVNGSYEYEIAVEGRRVPLANIRRSGNQPRRDLDTPQGQESIRRLAANISRRGLIQRLVVTEIPEEPGYYELYAGERRLRALDWLGAREVDVDVRQPIDRAAKLLMLQLSENEEREALSCFDLGAAFKQLQSHGYEIAGIAKSMQCTRTDVYDCIALSEASPRIRELHDTLTQSRSQLANMHLLEKADPEALTRLLEANEADRGDPLPTRQELRSIKARLKEKADALAVVEALIETRRQPKKPPAVAPNTQSGAAQPATAPDSEPAQTPTAPLGAPAYGFDMGGKAPLSFGTQATPGPDSTFRPASDSDGEARAPKPPTLAKDAAPRAVKGATTVCAMQVSVDGRIGTAVINDPRNSSTELLVRYEREGALVEQLVDVSRSDVRVLGLEVESVARAGERAERAA